MAQAVIDALDARAHGSTWEPAAARSQAQTPRPRFLTGIESLRGRLGNARARSIRGVGVSARLKDLPPGACVAARAATAFGGGMEGEAKIVLVERDGPRCLAGHCLRT